MLWVGLLLASAVAGGFLGWRLRPSARRLGVALVCLILLVILAFVGLFATYVDENCGEDPECNLVAGPASAVLLTAFPLIVGVVAALAARTVAGRR